MVQDMDKGLKLMETFGAEFEKMEATRVEMGNEILLILLGYKSKLFFCCSSFANNLILSLSPFNLFSLSFFLHSHRKQKYYPDTPQFLSEREKKIIKISANASRILKFD